MNSFSKSFSSWLSEYLEKVTCYFQKNHLLCLCQEPLQIPRIDFHEMFWAMHASCTHKRDSLPQQGWETQKCALTVWTRPLHGSAGQEGTITKVIGKLGRLKSTETNCLWLARLWVSSETMMCLPMRDAWEICSVPDVSWTRYFVQGSLASWLRVSNNDNLMIFVHFYSQYLC